MPFIYSIASTVFLSAFLLFLIQPMISRYILPWFGGTPAVWSAAILFFQTFLMAGYAYAHFLNQNKTKHSSRKLIVHACLLGLSLLVVASLTLVWGAPLLPDSFWKPPNANLPLLRVLTVLMVSVGLPYFVLATSSPLLQSWSRLLVPKHSPYQLYALSNLGSFLALGLYPLLFEPSFDLKQQAWLWAGGYLVFIIFCTSLLVKVYQHMSLENKKKPAAVSLEKTKELDQSATLYQKSLWIILPAISSILLLAVTNQLTQEIAVIPFLWVLPLGIYLLSFTLTFAERNWYKPVPTVIVLGISLLLLSYIMENLISIGIIIQIIIFSLFLLVASVFIHGELYQSRPAIHQLTSFYLLISVGSVIGSLFVNLVAPLIFRGYWELQLGMMACWILALLLVIGNRKSPHYRGEDHIVIYTWLLVMGLVGIIAFETFTSARLGTLEMQRNFYGILRVRRVTLGEQEIESNLLSHGATTHGYQFIDPKWRSIPTAYFGKDSGVGLTLTNYSRATGDAPGEGKFRVGIVGLGAGTLAAYGLAGDQYLFYEINPSIIDLAKGKGGYFTFLQDSPAKVNVQPGDGRLLLERALENSGGEEFDVLILDAFSSDSIPVHLLTTEAFDIYIKNLKPDGVLAINVSNRYLDISPLIRKLADANQLGMVLIHSDRRDPETFTAVWALLTSNEAFLRLPKIQAATDKLPVPSSDLRVWTDSYSNLLPYLRMENIFKLK